MWDYERRGIRFDQAIGLKAQDCQVQAFCRFLWAEGWRPFDEPFDLGRKLWSPPVFATWGSSLRLGAFGRSGTVNDLGRTGQRTNALQLLAVRSIDG